MFNEKGLKILTYSELLDEMELKAKDLFGEDINTRSYTPLGIILRIYAYFLSIIWQIIEKVYFSGFIKSSEGIQLDRHGGNRNIPRNAEKESTVFLNITGTSGYELKIGSFFETASGIRFFTIETAILDSKGIANVEAISFSKGAINNVPANSITVISEPIEQLLSVNNLKEATGGIDEESDLAYRQRLIKGNLAQNNATVDAIISKVSNVSGVVSVQVNVNNTMTEKNGIPPKTVNILAVGGNDSDIGKMIFNTIGAGVGTVGETKYIATALDGNKHEINFSKATTKLVYMKIEIESSNLFPLDGIQKMKDSIIEFIGGSDSNEKYHNGLGLLETLVYTKLFRQIYEIPGVLNSTVRIGLNQNNLTSSDILAPSKAILITSIEAIEVIVHAQ
ncbi:baseplate J/gp47 family protein [Carnobacterium gallinarum]|uniref:baseplate J/gp47 family protein n=1 Tax=Carnobacterium gallinarum TaxID=2749 RepID=UPI00054DD0B7|nr:baseplate J/gp47 family protein [Carnobacterium gallinarum]